MAFSERVKIKVKRRSHFSCCLCKSVGIEAHHIKPPEEGGKDTIENAAPLCPSCHEIYGANPQKRKFIKEARDFWYEICDQRYKTDSKSFLEIKKLIENGIKRKDLEEIKKEIISAISVKQKNAITPQDSPWSLQRTLAYFLNEKYPGLESYYDLLFEKVIWYKKEDKELWEKFHKYFGVEIAKILCLHTQEFNRVNLLNGFTGEQLEKVMNYLKVWVIILLMMRGENKIGVLKDESGDFIFIYQK